MPVLLALLGALTIFLILAPLSRSSRPHQVPAWAVGAPEARPAVKGLMTIVRLPLVQGLGRMMALLHPQRRREQVAGKIQTARLSITPTDFFAMKGLGLILPVGYGALLVQASGNQTVAVIVGLLCLPCYHYPSQWLDGRVRRRQEQLLRELPSFLNALAVTVDAGLNLVPALDELCRSRRGILVEEFRETLQAIEVLGHTPQDALQQMAERCGVKELSLFAGALELTLRKGGAGISQFLRERAHAAWLTRRKQAEELAQKASFKMFLPLIFLVLPALAVFMLGPTLLLLWNQFGRM